MEGLGQVREALASRHSSTQGLSSRAVGGITGPHCGALQRQTGENMHSFSNLSAVFPLLVGLRANNV